jgi:hypothetical protein
MTMIVTPEDAWIWLRKDLREWLGYDGIKAIIDWYDEFDENTEYDESLFYSWNVGETFAEVLRDVDERAYTALLDTDGEIETLCKETLESMGTLLETPIGYLWNE